MRKTWLCAAPILALVFAVFTGAAEARTAARVTLERVSDEMWHAEITTSEPVAALLLLNSRNDWRRKSWRVVSPGLKLERRGAHDVIYANGAKPFSRVRIKIKPYLGRLMAEYRPFLSFSDGGVAVYTGQFDLAVMKSPRDADRLPPRAEGFYVKTADVDIRFSDRGARGFYAFGHWSRGQARWTSDQAPTYVYNGPGRIEAERAISAVIDPGLAPWLRTELASFTARLTDYYSRRFQVPLSSRPAALVAYGGPARRGYQMQGSVLPGLVVLEMSGSSLSNGRSAAVRAQVRWFFAHEMSHFWNAQIVGMRTMTTAWIHEGGADATAIRAMAALAPEGFDVRQAFQDRLDKCIAASGRAGLNTALKRGAFDDYYSCGAVLHLIAEYAIKKKDPRADVLDFWRELIARAGARDGLVDEALWLETLADMSGNRRLTETIRAFLHGGVSRPEHYFSEVFAVAGVPHDHTRTRGLALREPGRRYAQR